MDDGHEVEDQDDETQEGSRVHGTGIDGSRGHDGGQGEMEGELEERGAMYNEGENGKGTRV